MKSGLILAASAAIVGSASCAVHKLKLDKIPLSEQLERADIAAHAKSLANKYSGQNPMGVLPGSYKEEMFKETSIPVYEDNHPVPVSNFLNAQCIQYRSASRYQNRMLTMV